jgi:hypothetical protein
MFTTVNVCSAVQRLEFRDGGLKCVEQRKPQDQGLGLRKGQGQLEMSVDISETILLNL